MSFPVSRVLVVSIAASLAVFLFFQRSYSADDQMQFSRKSIDVGLQLGRVMQKHKIAGLAVAVVKNGKTLWSAGYGKADVKRDVAASSDTVYRIASISKTFTAASLMVALDRGLVSVDADVSDYLGFKLRNPNFPETPITLKHLLTHTSGILDAGGPYDRFLSASKKPGSVSIDQFVTAEGGYYEPGVWGDYEPGSGTFNYSNYCSGLVATIIERVTKRRFDRFALENVLVPSGMSASFNVDDIKDFSMVGVCYKPDGNSYEAACDDFGGVRPAPTDIGKYKIGLNGLFWSPQGGLRSSVDDLARFMCVMIGHGKTPDGKSIFSEETWRLMHNTHWTGNGFDGFYREKGLGIQITDKFVAGERMFGHSGEAYGIISDMFYSPEKGFGIALISSGAVITDGSSSGIYLHEEEIAKILYDNFIK